MKRLKVIVAMLASAGFCVAADAPDRDEPYGDGVAIAIVAIGGLAMLGRKYAAEKLRSNSDGHGPAKVIVFPSPARSLPTARMPKQR